MVPARFTALLLGFLLLGIPVWAAAQTPTPGVVQETLRPGTTPPATEAPLPELDPPSAPGPAAPDDERRIPIQRFTFSGNTRHSDEELREVVAEMEGRELTLREIYQVADRLTDFYQKEGYSLTTVTVPAQRMRDGILRLEVVEGRVGELVLRDNQLYSDAFLKRRLQRVAPGSIVRFSDLEREILLLNDLPGLVARSVMQPGDDYGTTDLHLTMEENRFAGLATFDNHGREVVGKWRAGADFYINSPLGIGDRLNVGYTHTESNLLWQGRIGYGLPLSVNGSRLNLSYSRAEYDVGGEFSELEIEGISETARVQVVLPQIRSRRTNLNWVIGGARIKGRSDLEDVPLSDDAVRFVEAGFDFSYLHADGASSNLSAMLATNFDSNSDGLDNEALPPRLELRGGYEHSWSGGWSLLVRGEAVLSDDVMPDSNKYAIGGPASVRGFVSSRQRGDRGGTASLELRRFIKLVFASLQARSFVDVGTVRRQATPDVPSSSDSLAGAGLGLAALFGEGYVIDLQWAAPIDGKDSGEGRNSQFWVSLSASF
ncbi:ShlB/FhaC/HecB family hemolysin secretion/activation protein [Thiohalomonas denitrificans]|uniref:Hemolysin activation/secretion protein n=1 Tax=Thiohalomonas denitrificans TaxID=415747 RepID=A0A1G5Q3E3_9GAMM|nr:ShlB/FhaC/HecB family hemolysin secretion/activation protein [Thiohalomonas denitrificans]SCZ56128.1 Hemolysin activation/secretion protein [Thiohalomonas denitrificans]